jgi:uncharacterized protein YkwD
MRWPLVTSLVTALVVLQTGVSAAAPAIATDGFSARVLDLTNAERQRAGLGPLVLNDQLTSAAQGYSQVLASSGCFQHTCGPVPDFADRDGQAGYTGWISIGENIAAGYASPEEVVAGWMASPPHRANILSASFTEIGVGVVTGGGQLGTYWAAEFGSRPGTAGASAQDGLPGD